MFPLLKAQAELRPVLEKCFRSFKTKMFNLKSPSKLLLLWNVNSFKHNFLFRNIRSKTSSVDEVLVYESVNSAYFKKLKILNISQYVLWILWGASSYDLARKSYLKAEESNEKASKETQREMKLMMDIMVVCCAIGTVVAALVWLFIYRNVKCIKFNKPNKTIIFKTFTPFFKDREFSVPVWHVSGVKARINSPVYIPLKIKNRLFYYLVDANGEFKDQFTFDNIISLKRELKR